MLQFAEDHDTVFLKDGQKCANMKNIIVAILFLKKESKIKILLKFVSNTFLFS